MDDRPACSFERTVVFMIARHVPLYLRHPVRRVVASAEPCQTTFQIAPMPEIAIAEDHEAMPGEHYVRAARQLGNVEPVAKTSPP